MTSPEETSLPVETEAKLHASRAVFDALSGLETVEGWRAVERHDVRLRDTYWDTADRRLSRARGTLRVREMDGAPQAELTLKGPVPVHTDAGSPTAWTRTELTVAVPAGSGPDTWAGSVGAAPLLAALRRLGVADGLRPDIVLLNPRREIILEHGGGVAALSLDEVAIEGAPYRRRYVEIELKRGPAAALERLVQALVARYRLRPSRQAKVEAARRWLARYASGARSSG
jgi:inorganic triphosphatase YgiF